MDRRRFELQIDAVLVVYRAQRRAGDETALERVRRRGTEILDRLTDVADGDPQLERRLADARRELDAPLGDG